MATAILDLSLQPRIGSGVYTLQIRDTTGNSASVPVVVCPPGGCK